MLRKLLAASVIVVLCAGVTFAEEIFGVITKVEGNKVTFAKKEFKKDAEKGPEMTLPVAKDAKIVTAKFNKEDKKFEAGDALEGGLKHKMFSDIDATKGRRAVIITDDDNKSIKEIRVFMPRKKQ